MTEEQRTQHVVCPSPFPFPQPCHSYTRPVWSLLIHIKPQASCSLSIQEMTAKVYSRNYIQWMGRERTHCFESMAWFPLHSHQTDFSKLFCFWNKVNPWSSRVWFQWAVQPDQWTVSPPHLSWAVLICLKLHLFPLLPSGDLSAFRGQLLPCAAALGKAQDGLDRPCCLQDCYLVIWPFHYRLNKGNWLPRRF